MVAGGGVALFDLHGIANHNPSTAATMARG